mgnify:CR=1 FL=1
MKKKAWLFAAATLLGCSAGLRKFPLAEPMWDDPDRRPFSAQPEEYYSGLLWDGADMMVFRPFSRIWKVDPPGEAMNVNAMDEIPNSSWWVNRVGVRQVPYEEAANGVADSAETVRAAAA